MDSQRIIYYSDPSFPKALVERLSQRGYQLEAVRRGDDILHKAFAERIALIIAFAEMPGLQGLDLCRDVKSNAGLKDIPIFVFASRKGGDRQAFYAAGCDGYYEAPFDEVNVAQRVDELLLDRDAARKHALARVAIDYKLNAEVMSLNAIDLQQDTLFLCAKTPLEVGSRFKLALSVAGKTLLDAHAEVIRVESARGSARSPGMFVRFYEVDEPTRRILDAMTRQRTLAGAAWEELSVEAIADRVAAALAAPAEGGKKDPILERAGFSVGRMPAWEAAAYEGGTDAGEIDLLGDASAEAKASLRETAAILHKLDYHLSRYADFFYIGAVAARRLNAHSEEVLSRADGTADVISSLLQRLSSEADASPETATLVEHLTLAQDWLIEKMVRLRTIVAGSQKPAEFTQPTTSDGELCPSQELRYRCLGLVELFEFSSQNARKEYAKTLGPNLDLTDVSTFELVALLEGKLPASSMHPDIGAWTRALVARALEIADFLHDRRPVKESKPELVQEVARFAEEKLTALLEIQEHYRRDLQRLSNIRAVSRVHLTELAGTHRRLLEAGAKLLAHWTLQAPGTTGDLAPRLLAAASSAAEIVAPMEGAKPLLIPQLGVVDTGPARPLGIDKDKSVEAERSKSPSALTVWLAGDPRRKWYVMGGLLAGLAGAGVFAWLTLNPSRPNDGSVDVIRYKSVLAVERCERKKIVQESGTKEHLRCIVDGSAWRKQPIAARKKSFREFVRRLSDDGVKVSEVLLYDRFDTELGIGSSRMIEVYDN